MKKLFYISVLIACMIGVSPALAQSTFSMEYSIGTGSGETKSFISSPSFRGGMLAYRRMINPNIGVGVDAGWNIFYERRAYDTYTSGTVSLSGVQYRYINAIPIYLAFDYCLKPNEKLNPFFGLGVGTIYLRKNTDMNVYTIENNAWAFALRPEAGVRLEASPGMDFILAAKYNYAFSTDALNAQSYFTFNIGFVFKGR